MDAHRQWWGALCAWKTRGHFIEHVAGNERGKVGSDLGHIWANLDYGLKSKVAAHATLYHFR
jgi:hypothetical protein